MLCNFDPLLVVQFDTLAYELGGEICHPFDTKAPNVRAGFRCRPARGRHLPLVGDRFVPRFALGRPMA